MIKDDALNAIIGDTFIEEPAKREELVAPTETAKVDEQEVEGSATKPKQATGYEDAKVIIELISLSSLVMSSRNKKDTRLTDAGRLTMMWSS